MARIEVIDIGTVSVRMGISDVTQGRIETFTKKTRVCDLGVGLDETGVLSEAAIERVLDTVRGYLGCFTRNRCDAVVCTLTQSAREAENADALLAPLAALGLKPQVIDGRTEGLIAAYGVSIDPRFAGEQPGAPRPLVADSGGGSTELCVLDDSESWVCSTPVGSRRVSERFLSAGDPASEDDVARALKWCRDTFAEAAATTDLIDPAASVVVCGGASTTLAAVHHELEPYNPAIVHGTVLSKDEIAGMVERFAGMTVAERGEVVGVHPDRAPVVLGSAVVLEGLLEALGKDELVVSEADNLQGIALLADAELAGAPAPIEWRPALTLSE